MKKKSHFVQLSFDSMPYGETTSGKDAIRAWVEGGRLWDLGLEVGMGERGLAVWGEGRTRSGRLRGRRCPLLLAEPRLLRDRTRAIESERTNARGWVAGHHASIGACAQGCAKVEGRRGCRRWDSGAAVQGSRPLGFSLLGHVILFNLIQEPEVHGQGPRNRVSYPGP